MVALGFARKLKDASKAGRGAALGLVEECLFQWAQMTGACDWREMYEGELKVVLGTLSTDATLVRVLAEGEGGDRGGPGVCQAG